MQDSMAMGYVVQGLLSRQQKYIWRCNLHAMTVNMVDLGPPTMGCNMLRLRSVGFGKYLRMESTQSTAETGEHPGMVLPLATHAP